MTSNEECGFDNHFVTDVSEHLKCPVCMLVLRQPVQIMNCGHRFCQPCFHRIQTYSQYLKSPLLCPVDGNPVDLGMVFQDNGVSRMIDDLEVKCGSSELGCPWIGTLGNLNDHQIGCEYQQQCPAMSGDASSVERQELEEVKRRLEMCEDSAAQQEKNTESFLVNQKEMEQKVSEKEEEVEMLKETVLTLQKEVRSLKEVAEVFRAGFAAEVEYLKRKWLELDENVVLLTKRNMHRSDEYHLSDDSCDSDDYLPSRVDRLESGVDVLGRSRNTSNDGMCAVETDDAVGNDMMYSLQQFKTSKTGQSDKSIQTPVYHDDDEYVVLPKREPQHTNLANNESEEGNIEVGDRLSAYEKEILTQIENVRLEEMPIAQGEVGEPSSINASAGTEDKANEEPTRQQTAAGHNNENRKQEWEQEPNKEEVGLLQANEMIRLDKHIRNIENILFAYNRHEKTKKDTKLKWVLQNYQHLFNIGETVCSPIYATNIKGYYFKMFINWNGDEKQNLGLYLRICAGDNDKGRPLAPFDSEYTLEIMDRKGGSRSFNVSTLLINMNREDCFVIHPGEKQSRFGFGDDEMLPTACIKKYLVDDTMFISCTIHSKRV